MLIMPPDPEPDDPRPGPEIPPEPEPSVPPGKPLPKPGDPITRLITGNSLR